MNRIILLILLFLTMFISTSYAVTDSFQATKWYVVTNNSVYMNVLTGGISIPQKTNNNFVYLNLICSGQQDIYVHINISYKSTNTTWSYIDKDQRIICSPAGTVNTIKIPINFVYPGNYIFNINISNNYCGPTGCYVLSTTKIRVKNIQAYFKQVENTTGVVANFNSYITDSLTFTVTKTKFDLLTSFGKFSTILFILLGLAFLIMYFRTKEKKYLILAFALFIVSVVSKFATIYMYPSKAVWQIYNANNLYGAGGMGQEATLNDHIASAKFILKTEQVNDTINKTSNYVYETTDYVINIGWNVLSVSHDYNTVKEYKSKAYLKFPLLIEYKIPVSNTSTLLGCIVTECTTSNGNCTATIDTQKEIILKSKYYHGWKALYLKLHVDGKNQEYSVSPVPGWGYLISPIGAYLVSHLTSISYNVLPSQGNIRVNCVFREVKAISPNTSVKQLPTVNLDQYVKKNLNNIANNDNKKLNNSSKKRQDISNYIFFGAMILGVLFARKKRLVKH